MKAVLPDFIHVEGPKNKVQYLAVRFDQSSHPHTTVMYNSVAGGIKTLWLAPSFFGEFLATSRALGIWYTKRQSGHTHGNWLEVRYFLIPRD